MIAPQSPPPQVLMSAQSMLAGDVPSQRLPPVAAVQTNHILMAHGTPDRHSRGQDLLGLNGLSKLAERLVHGSDDLRKLLRAHFMLSYVAPDDLSGENWISPFNIHDIDPRDFARIVIHNAEGNRLKEASGNLLKDHSVITTLWLETSGGFCCTGRDTKPKLAIG
jgi:hypothetical protein